MAAATEGLEKLEDMIVRQAEATGAQVAAAKAAIGNVIFGQEQVVEQALITVLCGGHALLIGLPGLAKTKLVETMGIVLGLDARRIQFTPDLMPSDVLGSEVLDESPGGTGRWQTCRQKRKGGFAVGGGEPPFGMKGRHGAGLGKQEGGVSFMMPEMPGTPEPWLWLNRRGLSEFGAYPYQRRPLANAPWGFLGLSRRYPHGYPRPQNRGFGPETGR